MRNDPASPNYDPGLPPGFDYTLDDRQPTHRKDDKK